MPTIATGTKEPLGSDDTGLDLGLPVAAPGAATPGIPPAVINPATSPGPGHTHRDGYGREHVHLDERVHEPKEPGMLDGLLETLRGWFGRGAREG